MTIWQWAGLEGASWRFVPLVLLVMSAVLFFLHQRYVAAIGAVVTGFVHELAISKMSWEVAALFYQSKNSASTYETIDWLGSHAFYAASSLFLLIILCFVLWTATIVQDMWLRHGALYLVLTAMTLIVLDAVMMVQVTFTGPELFYYPMYELPKMPEIPEIMLYVAAVIIVTTIITDLARAYGERRKKR